MIRTSIVERKVKSMTLDPLLMTFLCHQGGSSTGRDGTSEAGPGTSVVSITATTRMGTTSVAAQRDHFLKEVITLKSRREANAFTPRRISIGEVKDTIARRSAGDVLTGSSAIILDDSILVIEISTEAQATGAAIKTFSLIQRTWTRNTHSSFLCLVTRSRALIRPLRWLSAKILTQLLRIKKAKWLAGKYTVKYHRTLTSRNFNTNHTLSSNKEGNTPEVEMTKQALRCLAVASNPYSPRKTHLTITTRIRFRCGLRRLRNDSIFTEF